MLEEKEISRAVIKRLPRYYRYLGELLDDGVERISSNELRCGLPTFILLEKISSVSILFTGQSS